MNIVASITPGEKRMTERTSVKQKERQNMGEGHSLENSAVMESRSVNGDEPLVGRNIFHRVNSGQKAKLSPRLWAGGTKGTPRRVYRLMSGNLIQ